MKDLLTICIPTHTVKTETRGAYAHMNNIIPSAPSTRMIEYILEDLFKKTDIPKSTPIIIGVDNRLNRSIDTEYVKNLEKLSALYENLKVIPTNSKTYDPLISAPINFTNIIGAVTTPYYFLLEHDWIFNLNVNIQELLNNMIKYDQYYVRFNQHVNKMGPNAAEKYMYPETNTDIPLLKVDHMGNNPYICKTEIFNKWWKHLLYETPEEGGFVEGPINVFYKFSIQKMGFEKANENWKIYVYGSPNDPAYVHHLNGGHFV